MYHSSTISFRLSVRTVTDEVSHNFITASPEPDPEPGVLTVVSMSHTQNRDPKLSAWYFVFTSQIFINSMTVLIFTNSGCLSIQHSIQQILLTLLGFCRYFIHFPQSTARLTFCMNVKQALLHRQTSIGENIQMERNSVNLDFAASKDLLRFSLDTH